jgi:modified peptide precursor CbpA
MHTRVFSRSPFAFNHPEEWIMSQTVQTQASPVASSETVKATMAPMAPTIASRKSCNPDGIGLSHYVLMDKKAAK